MIEDSQKALRDDVRLLGELLGETLRAQEGDALYERVERVRALAKRRRHLDPGESATEGFEALATELAGIPVSEALPLARAFAHFLNLANIAEQHHRIRRRRAYQRNPSARAQPASIEETLPRLLAGGISAETLERAVADLRIGLVMTAHPTEIMRRTLQHKYNRIAEALAEHDRDDLTPLERETLIATLRREITAAWETDEVRRERPTPLDEVRSALTVFEETIWRAVPEFLRSLDRSVREVTRHALPLDAAPIRFGSWIGGDRDGNPNVTPDVTRRACLMTRWTATTLYAREIELLADDLSMTDCSAALRAMAGEAHEPYRAVMRALLRRLEATRLEIERALGDSRLRNDATGPAAPAPAPIDNTRALLEPLQVCDASLRETGNGIIADGRLADVLRRLAVFGVTLVRLDIRQDSRRHTETLDAICRHRGLAAFGESTEEQRIAFLMDALQRPTDFVPDDFKPEDDVADVMETFRAIRDIPAESLGAYVITMAGRPSDVLAVELLQRAMGVAQPLRVVPLFEVAKDLIAAGGTIDTLLSIPWYRRRVFESEGGRQEVMIGYSDSAKDIGRIAAAWDIYKAQESVIAAAHAHGVAITIFHGRGGSVGRGGGPTYLAIQSQPPGSLDGTLRVTEQGEMIQAKFGLPGIALRSLEVYTTATLEATLTPKQSLDPRWPATMDRLAAAARTAFRAVVYDDPRFPQYLRTATPEDELDQMHIGSRPAHRTAGTGLATLRAIPWQFAWTQTRLLLPTWLGAEELVGAAISDEDRQVLRDMYRAWPFFRSTLDLTAMALAKADAGIAAYYDRQLVPDDLRPIGQALRDKLDRAIAGLSSITGHRVLLADNPVLRRSIDVRNPYVDPINLLQVELLRRLRVERDGNVADELRRALLVTINGVAAGMRNTG